MLTFAVITLDQPEAVTVFARVRRLPGTHCYLSFDRPRSLGQRLGVYIASLLGFFIFCRLSR